MNTLEHPQLQVVTFDELHDAVPAVSRGDFIDYWAERSLKQVRAEMPKAERYGHANIHVVQPDGEVNETRTLLLPLEFNQNVTEAHYMRAKVVQQYVDPTARVLIVPNSSYDQPNVVDIRNGLSDAQRAKMAKGDIRPYITLLADTVEQADRADDFGRLDIIGSSQASLVGLGFADYLNVGKILAHETPSLKGRDDKGLSKDFQKSGDGLMGVWNSIKGSEIPAQKQAMQFPHKYLRDFGKFGIRTLSPDSKLLAKAMSGSAEYLAAPAVAKLGKGALTFSFVEGSTIYDPQSLSPQTRQQVNTVLLVGPEMHAHASSNNLRLTAALAHYALNG